jgi:TP901 family phage tail tape measure protein
MAEEFGSKLGFDISEAVASLNKLKREFDAYNASLNKVAGASDQFNSSQRTVDDLLKRVSTSAQLAAGQLKQFAAAQKAAGNSSSAFIKAQKDQLKFFTSASAAQLAGEGKRGPLSSFVDASAERRAAQQKAALDSLRQQEAALRAAFGRGGGGSPLTRIAAGAEGDGKKLTKIFNDVGQSWRNLTKTLITISFAISGLRQIADIFSDGTKAARDFEIQLAQIQTISQEFQRAGLDATAEAVRRLSDQFGQPIEDVASGLYETLSNQIGNAAESTAFLSDALTFSRAAVTSTADAVDLLSGVINSYGLTAASAGNISDQLFVTIDRGRVRGSELANTFGRILPLANTLGIELSEVNTALAELTIQGVKPSDALTQMTNVMLKLIKPTEALQKVFDDMGIASAEAGIAIFGFDGFIREVTKNAKGSATEIGELFNQIRGTRGVLGIITRDSEKYAETLREIQQASEGTGAAIKAANIILQTPAQQLTIELNKVRNFLINDIGRTAVAALNNLFQNVISAKNAFVLLAGAIGLIAAGGFVIFVGQAVVALGSLSTAFVATATAAGFANVTVGTFAALIGTIVVPIALTGIALAMLQVRDAAGQAATKLADLQDQAGRLGKADIEAARAGLEERKKAVDENIAAITDQFRKFEVSYQKDKKAALAAQEDVTAGFKDQLSKRQSAIQTFLSQLDALQRDATRNIKDLQDEQLDFEFGINSSRFERDLQELSDPEEIARQLAARSQKVLEAAQEAIGKGNIDFGKQLFGEALDLANRAADQTGQRAVGEGQINRVLRERQSLNDALIDQEQRKAQQAAQAEAALREQLLKTARDIDKFNTLNERIAEEQLKPGSKTDRETLKQLVEERQKLAQDIQSGISSISIENLPALRDLTDLVRDIQAPFTDPTTGVKGRLDFVAATSIDSVLSNFQRTADQTPIKVRVLFESLTGEAFDPLEGFGAGQNAAAQVGRSLQQNIENEANLGPLQRQVDALNQSLAGLGENFANVGRDAQFAGATGAEAFNAANPALITFRQNIESLLQRGQTAALQGDIQTLTQVRTELERLQGLSQTLATRQGTGLFGTGFDPAGIFGDLGTGQELADLFGQAVTQINALAEAQAKLGQAQEKATNTGLVEQAVNAQDPAALQFLNIINNQLNAQATLNAKAEEFGAAATTGTQTATQALDQFSTQPAIDEYDRLISKINEVQAAQATVGTVQAQAKGGLIQYFADGGFAPRGTDTVPAMLSPGEFVVNSKSARQFYSELVAINAGVRPSYMAEGGSVTNNIGDININVPTQSKSINGRELAKELRRELRRQTSRI